MKGNRPRDVCALCDQPIDLAMTAGWVSLHRYLGAGWVHGGGREYIPVHHGCAYLSHLSDDAPVRAGIVAALRPTHYQETS